MLPALTLTVPSLALHALAPSDNISSALPLHPAFRGGLPDDEDDCYLPGKGISRRRHTDTSLLALENQTGERVAANKLECMSALGLGLMGSAGGVSRVREEGRWKGSGTLSHSAMSSLGLLFTHLDARLPAWAARDIAFLAATEEDIVSARFPPGSRIPSSNNRGGSTTGRLAEWGNNPARGMVSGLFSFETKHTSTETVANMRMDGAVQELELAGVDGVGESGFMSTDVDGWGSDFTPQKQQGREDEGTQGGGEEDAGHLRRLLREVHLRVEARRQQWEQEAVQLMARMSARRCNRSRPMHGIDAADCLTVLHPARHAHRLAKQRSSRHTLPTCFTELWHSEEASGPLPPLIRDLEGVIAHTSDAVLTYMFAIPKARAGAPQLVCLFPGMSEEAPFSCTRIDEGCRDVRSAGMGAAATAAAAAASASSGIGASTLTGAGASAGGGGGAAAAAAAGVPTGSATSGGTSSPGSAAGAKTTGSSAASLPVPDSLASSLAVAVSPLLSPLRMAAVRRQLFFPDRRLVQFDCGKLQVRA